MTVLTNIILTICAMIVIAVAFPICLLIAVAKKIRGNEPMLYDRYVEE